MTILHTGHPDRLIAIVAHKIEYVGPVEKSGVKFTFVIGMDSRATLDFYADSEVEATAARNRLIERIS